MFNGSIALIGETGSGKTTQIGVLAKWVYKTYGLKSVLFTCERGGYESIRHLVDLGIIKVVQYDFEMDPFVWQNHVIKGEEYIGGKWVPLDKSLYGLWAYDSGTSMAEQGMEALSIKQASGQAIGGAASFNVTLGDGSKLSGNTMTHYGVSQMDMRSKIWRSQRLPGVVLWTFSLDRGEKADETQVAGPALSGHSLTPQIPRWFIYTFRIAEELNAGQKPDHVLYLQSHTSGTLGSFGNARVPIEGFEELDLVIKPASLVEAIERIETIRAKALEQARTELGL